MRTNQRTSSGFAAGSHFAQFFDTDDSRVEHVAGYVATALAAGDRVLLVLDRQRWNDVSLRLHAIGADIDGAQQDGDLVMRESMKVLPRLLQRGTLSAERFDCEVAAPVRRLVSDGRRLRVYGELVDILAQRGEHHLSVRLEQYWNGLAAEVPMTLFCGYSALNFGHDSEVEHLQAVCRCHSHVRAARYDLLSSFLLATHVHPPRFRER